MKLLVTMILFAFLTCCKTTESSSVASSNRKNFDAAPYVEDFQESGFDAVFESSRGEYILGVWKRTSGYEGKFASVSSGRLVWQNSIQVFKPDVTVPFASEKASVVCTAGLTGDCYSIYIDRENKIRAVWSDTAFQNQKFLKELWHK